MRADIALQEPCITAPGTAAPSRIAHWNIVRIFALFSMRNGGLRRTWPHKTNKILCERLNGEAELAHTPASVQNAC